MAEKKFRVHFAPHDLETYAAGGTNLLEAARAAGVPIHASCGGVGVCGTCKVRIEKGQVESSRTRVLSEAEYDQGVRQACQTQILSDVDVFVPIESRLEQAVLAREKKQAAGIAPIGWRFKPPVSKLYLELPAPTIDDNTSDLSRLLREIRSSSTHGNLQVDFAVIRKLPEACRRDNWKVTVTLLTLSKDFNPGSGAEARIVDVEPGDTRAVNYALAIDVGTTTVCAQLLDLNRGEIAADNIVFNKQISYGADVISRIAYSQKPGGLLKLQREAVASINEVLAKLLDQSQIGRKDIALATLAGNTTMTQLLLGVNPKYVRLAPYTPALNFVPLLQASSLGIQVPESVYLVTFPAVSSYVGGDIVSGVIPAGFYQRNKLTFYMDIGTNGEIVIGNCDWMVTASCSAGPAFEGGGIKFGMVAVNGAIQDFEIDQLTLEPIIDTIGGEKPKGICGSGLINAIAGLLETGVIGQNGKFEAGLATDRVRRGEDGYEYVIAWAADTQIGKDIVLTEVDIDNLIRAKAAMYAGCHTLARSVGVQCRDFDHIILAGNFGNSVDIEKAITIGLLPDVPREKFIFIGNGSLSGARLAAFSSDLLEDALKVGRMMTNIELSDNLDFNHNYVAALFLPHTETEAFPSVKEKMDRLALSRRKGGT
jgi:uncharacterized 2Fe-2S/4Fe-4S cluster protein (DUF4445 family)